VATPGRGKRALLIALVAVAAAVGSAHAAPRASHQGVLLAPPGRCGNPAVPADPGSQIAAMLCYHNYARAQEGLKALTIDGRLSTFGRQKLAQIVKCGTFTHSPCGVDAFTGFPSGFTAAGENLVYWSPTGTVRQQMTTWLHSPDHLENIVSPSYARVGFAVYDGPAFGYPEVRMWIADFGS
jgi:uncharacterized protein YkwD